MKHIVRYITLYIIASYASGIMPSIILWWKTDHTVQNALFIFTIVCWIFGCIISSPMALYVRYMVVVHEHLITTYRR
jgi:hypothetical protein